MTKHESRVTSVSESGARPFVAPSPKRARPGLDPDAVLREAKAEAVERGYREGYDEGRGAALAEHRARIEAIGASLDALATLRSEIVRQAEQDLLRLAIRIAEAVVREKVAEDSGPAVRALADALAEIPRTETLTVRCHPDEEAPLTAWLGRPGGAPDAFSVRPDPSIARGGCIVESPLGEIDMRVESQLRVLEHELLSRS